MKRFELWVSFTTGGEEDPRESRRRGGGVGLLLAGLGVLVGVVGLVIELLK